MTELYSDGDLNECLRKFIPSEYRDDFKQDLFIRLHKYKDTLIKAYSAGQHKYYVARIIINQASESRSMLNYTYRKVVTVPLDYKQIGTEESFPFEVRKMKEDKEDAILKKLETIDEVINQPRTCSEYPYYSKLCEVIKVHGTAGKVSKATGIPKSSVQQGIKKIRQYLKND